MKEKVESIIRANRMLAKTKKEVCEFLVQKAVDHIARLSIYNQGYISEAASALADPPLINNAVLDQIEELERQGVHVEEVLTLSDFRCAKRRVVAKLRLKWGMDT